MVKPVQRSEILGFSKGLATDLNPLTSQIDTTSDEVNFELLSDGTRSRRLGLDIEPSGETFDTGLTWNRLKLASTSSYLWEGAAGEPKNKFLLLQVGRTLYFFKAGAGLNQETLLIQSLDIPDISDNAKLGFGAVEGFLGVTNGTPNIGLIEYNQATNTFSYSVFRIRIRDQFGIEETIQNKYEIDKGYRGALNWQHYYNLYNQGWAIPRKDWQYGSPPPIDAVLLGAARDLITRTPSNSDVVWSGMSKKPIADQSLESFDAFHYRQFEAITGADTVTAKGYFLIDAFNRGSSRYEAWIEHRNKYPQTGTLVSGLNPPNDTTSGGPASLASHAGRLFFSGCRGVVSGRDSRSPNYNNYVFFSQLIKNKQDFSKCYQEGDPTSQDSSEVVDTDGGFFIVSEAVNIHTMYSMGDRLFLIAENGVWSVTGGNNYGFSATNYKVEKLSTSGGIPNRSFIEYEGNGHFWGWEGIYSISRNQYGDYTVENISKDRIESFYSNINDVAKQTCQAFIDRTRRQIRWLYTEGDLFENGQSKELIMDLKYQAVYPFSISRHPDDNAYILAGAQLGSFSEATSTSNVVVAGDQVVVGVDNVITNATNLIALDSTVKYVSIREVEDTLRLSFCEYRNPYYEDWSFTGRPIDAESFMTTNAFTGGDFAIKKQVPYLVMAFAETERTVINNEIFQDSSCLGQFRWNFTHLDRSNKWGREQQLYRKSKYYFNDSNVDNGFSINITKTKIRGSGRSFSLRVKTEPRKACRIYGWNLTTTVNGVA